MYSYGAESPVNGSQSEFTDDRAIIGIVDDEPMIRTLIRSVLEIQGYHIQEATSAIEALEQWNTTDSPLDLLITDIRMPGLTGTELARRFRQQRPVLPVIFISGYSGETPMDLGDEQMTAFLAKPFPLPELSRAVRRLLTPDPVTV